MSVIFKGRIVAGKLVVDAVPTAGSTNPVSSQGVKAALDAKQNILTFDQTPTAGSQNPVTSGGVKSAINALTPTLYKASITTNQYGVVTTDLPASAILLDYWTTSRNFIFAYKSADSHWAFGLCDVGANNNLVVLPNSTTVLNVHYISS